MSAPASPGVVIVGGGQAGAQTAIGLRAAGFEGAVTILADEAHLPYERPPLSKALLLDPGSPEPTILSHEGYERSAIDLKLGLAATAIDRAGKSVALSDGSRLPYAALVLATGSRPRELEIPGYRQQQIHYLRTLGDSRTIGAALAERPSVVLIGGGFIGLEAAAAMRERGCAVTVIEKAPCLLPRLRCAEVSAAVLAYHRGLGIDVRVDTGVASGGGDFLLLDDGTRVDADMVIAGIGIIPETTLARDAGLAVDDGIVVDAHGRTSDPDIFAAGDATRGFHGLLDAHVRLESWQNANLQAQAVARTIAGQDLSAPEPAWAWSDQGDLNLQVAGMPAAVDRTVVRPVPDDPTALTALQLFEGRLVGGLTLNNGKDMAIIRRLLAAGGVLGLPFEQLTDAAIALRKFLPSRDSK